ncbi:CBS-domain-containing membrane protein [Paraburkholderia bannensis]|uniref:CBS-domain-containing membrane protein n=1 Tax=Paraburkholderia bannensis TaxID=765414 RepID=A0A7W9TXD0_9BURK|nr:MULTISPECIES: CBS domain-containing protein [Paraburkholderia]MBB3258119.1 CBS-domain-containing membrane protein [Paraburkholderia sp. WP4_3_2]MBB6103132.1 CBS-domain-containing membrane protein [Paraburkholderia bannensis]
MQASDIMTTEVISVPVSVSVFDVAELMAKHHISGLPVLGDDGKIAGMVSEGDLLHRVETGTGKPQRSWFAEFLYSTRRLATEYLKEHALKVSDVMTANVVSVLPQTPLADVADLLQRHRIKRVPVVVDGKVLGIVSRSNLVQALARAAQGPSDALASDEALRQHVVQVLSGHRWAMAAEDVVVKDGIVHLWGTVTSEEERRAICVSAERVIGVKGVEDHLGYPTYFTPM